jgi:hypothetical protein
MNKIKIKKNEMGMEMSRNNRGFELIRVHCTKNGNIM